MIEPRAIGTVLAGAMLLLLLAIPSPQSVAASDQTPQRVTCDPVTPTGVLLVQPLAAGGAPRSGLLALDPATGDELGRIELPVVDRAFPTPMPHRSLAIAGAELYLIDTETLFATSIPLGDVSAADLAPNPIQFRGTAGSRYMLLGSPGFDRALLIDVEVGVAISLPDLIAPRAPEATVFISFAAVTPDDAHVLMWDGRHVYVVATDNIGTARRIDDGAFAFAPDFSADGQQVIFSQSDGPGTGSTLMIGSFDDSIFDGLKSSDSALVTLWVPGTNTILVDERTEEGAAAGSAYVLDLDTDLETPLLDYQGSLTTVQFDPEGTRALLGVESFGDSSWHLAELETGTVRALPQIAGTRVLPGLYADNRWALSVPGGDSADPLVGPVYRAIDLENGAVGRLLEQAEDLDFEQQPTLAGSGRFSVVTGESPSRQTAWLLDTVELTSTEIGSGATVTATFSPDACHAAVTVETIIDGISSFAVSVQSTTDAERWSIGQGKAFVWASN